MGLSDGCGGVRGVEDVAEHPAATVHRYELVKFAESTFELGACRWSDSLDHEDGIRCPLGEARPWGIYSGYSRMPDVPSCHAAIDG